jgi:hypothetical protein
VPQFNVSKAQLEDLVQFLGRTNGINTDQPHRQPVHRKATHLGAMVQWQDHVPALDCVADAADEALVDGPVAPGTRQRRGSPIRLVP